MYILDTNILIYFFKGLGQISEKLLSVPPKDIGVPSIVIYELEVGINKSLSPRKRKAQLRQFTDAIHVLPFGLDEARQAAKIRSKLEIQGNPIGPYDVLIAATALSQKGVLVTHNTKEFERVKGLQIEDWYKAHTNQNAGQ